MDLYYLDSVQTGATALIVAAQEGHVRAVEILIAAKAKIDIQKKVRFTICLLVIIWICTQNGATALYMASKKGHCGVVRMLLEAKADVKIKTNVSHAA